MLGRSPISFEEGDLYLISFNRTQNVAFVETIVYVCGYLCKNANILLFLSRGETSQLLKYS